MQVKIILIIFKKYNIIINYETDIFVSELW